jgi:hypothetical protein
MNRVLRTQRAVAWLLSVDHALVRDWKRRGLIGPVCDIRTRQEGYDRFACLQTRDNLARTRPRRPGI